MKISTISVPYTNILRDDIQIDVKNDPRKLFRIFIQLELKNHRLNYVYNALISCYILSDC